MVCRTVWRREGSIAEAKWGWKLFEMWLAQRLFCRHVHGHYSKHSPPHFPPHGSCAIMPHALFGRARPRNLLEPRHSRFNKK